jgi:hypothetical protein
MRSIFAFVFMFSIVIGANFSIAQTSPAWQGKFEQLGQTLPTPNEYRTGSGAPGPKYWQQKADYDIAIELDDTKQSISGSETITYNNNSPDVLKYLWLQLDQNILAPENTLASTTTGALKDSAAAKTYATNVSDFKAGFDIKSVKEVNGKPLPHTINNTMMRVDLPQPLRPGEKYSFQIEWSYNIVDRSVFGQRSGMEYFPEDGNYLYTIAQFFPRMCVYDDYQGWQNKQFLGRAEFTLPFGDYKVRITVPSDHVVAATGTLKNTDVLSKSELAQFEKAKTSFDKPVIIVSQQEATQKEKTKSSQKKTWEFSAENVRDFAFATSRKFIWDAQAVKLGGKTALAMSFYPKEGNPLWEKESTKAVKNTLEVYSKYTIDYPYPVAISVHTASIGMEYPMICFNYGRPNKDGSYTALTRRNMIGVIVHEVGHNFFPMIVNSDERQTTWMDEGIDSFVQLLTEQERYPDIDWSTARGTPAGLAPYLKGAKNNMRPLMVTGDQVIELGNEQYSKAATGLTILRETVMGPELFDKAFKEYAQRWAFKHPKPADFFRTMEDASAVDLDWFWKGWFYTTDVCDQSIDQVKWFKMRKEQTDLEKKNLNVAKGDLAGGSGKNYSDFSGGPEPFSLVATDPRLNGEFMSRVDDKAIMQKLEDKNIYEVTLTNKGGLVMPVIIEWTYKDGTKEIERIPAEIWRVNEQKITKVFVKQKEVVNMVLDPKQELTDVNMKDNVFPKRPEASKFDDFKKKTK